MNGLHFIFCISALLALKDLPTTTPETPERIRVLAIHGSDEGRAVPDADPTLAPVQTLLDTLPYDTYREVAFEELTVNYGEDGAVKLNDIYTLHCSPLRLTEDAEIVLEAHVDMEEAGRVIEAVRVTGRAERGQGMVFRGFSMDTGELIVILSIAEAKNDDGGTGGSGAPQGQQDPAEGNSTAESSGADPGTGANDPEATEAGETPPSEMDGEEDENTDPKAMIPVETPPEDEAPPLPTELANLEGILRALEEVDRREQAASRARQYETEIRGDWW